MLPQIESITLVYALNCKAVKKQDITRITWEEQDKHNCFYRQGYIDNIITEENRVVSFHYFCENLRWVYAETDKKMQHVLPDMYDQIRKIDDIYMIPSENRTVIREYDFRCLKRKRPKVETVIQSQPQQQQEKRSRREVLSNANYTARKNKFKNCERKAREWFKNHKSTANQPFSNNNNVTSQATTQSQQINDFSNEDYILDSRHDESITDTINELLENSSQYLSDIPLFKPVEESKNPEVENVDTNKILGQYTFKKTSS